MRNLHLAKIGGIDLYLHWSWFLVALIEIQARSGAYTSVVWNVAEYLALFAIVTVHEFGHAFACRSVGGRADRIMLWPLGGIAFVDPPPRPGPVLWSIAAGPLVNVVLLWPLFQLSAWVAALPGVDINLALLAHSVAWINLALLVFNVIPVYPLDGGQILQSLLWFLIGRARSLMAAAAIGIVGAGAFALYAFSVGNWLLVAIAAFVLMECWNGWQRARGLWKLAKLPQRTGFACPDCRATPPAGELWNCRQCGQPCDVFATTGACPHCGAPLGRVVCPACGHAHPLGHWVPEAVVLK